MKDKVQTEDYLKYLTENRLVHWKAMNAEAKLQYHYCKNKYERKYLPSLFKWKFEDSYSGNTHWLHGSWDFYDSNIARVEKEINRATYHMKTKQIYIEVEYSGDLSAFYEWCSENNIPY